MKRKRDAIIEQLSLSGVAVNVHFIPLPMMSYYKELGYDIVNFPVAYDNYKAEISLPVFYDMLPEQVEQVVTALNLAVTLIKSNTLQLVAD